MNTLSQKSSSMLPKLHTLFTVLMIVFVGLVQAQTQTEKPDLPQVVGPSPEVASLAKFGEISTDYANGLYNLSVPIYNIKTPYFSLPISLNHHSLGVVVSEMASSVGTNWSLSAGGNISTIEGIASVGLGVAGMLVPEPTASKVLGVASIATGVDALVRTTDPEKIKIRISF